MNRKWPTFCLPCPTFSDTQLQNFSRNIEHSVRCTSDQVQINSHPHEILGMLARAQTTPKIDVESLGHTTKRSNVSQKRQSSSEIEVDVNPIGMSNGTPESIFLYLEDYSRFGNNFFCV